MDSKGNVGSARNENTFKTALGLSVSLFRLPTLFFLPSLCQEGPAERQTQSNSCPRSLVCPSLNLPPVLRASCGTAGSSVAYTGAFHFFSLNAISSDHLPARLRRRPCEPQGAQEERARRAAEGRGIGLERQWRRWPKTHLPGTSRRVPNSQLRPADLHRFLSACVVVLVLRLSVGSPSTVLDHSVMARESAPYFAICGLARACMQRQSNLASPGQDFRATVLHAALGRLAAWRPV